MIYIKNKNEILQTVIDIFNSRYNKNIDISSTSLLYDNFFGPNIRMRPCDLLYLFFDIESAFDINIPSKPVLEGKFCSLSSVVDIIEEVINKVASNEKDAR